MDWAINKLEIGPLRAGLRPLPNGLYDLAYRTVESLSAALYNPKPIVPFYSYHCCLHPQWRIHVSRYLTNISVHVSNSTPPPPPPVHPEPSNCKRVPFVSRRTEILTLFFGRRQYQPPINSAGGLQYLSVNRRSEFQSPVRRIPVRGIVRRKKPTAKGKKRNRQLPNGEKRGISSSARTMMFAEASAEACRGNRASRGQSRTTGNSDVITISSRRTRIPYTACNALFARRSWRTLKPPTARPETSLAVARVHER